MRTFDFSVPVCIASRSRGDVIDGYVWRYTKDNTMSTVHIIRSAMSTSTKAAMKFQQAPGHQPVLAQCWASVADAGPTFNQHWDIVVQHLRHCPNVVP